MNQRPQSPTMQVGRWLRDARRAVARLHADQSPATPDLDRLDHQARLAVEATAVCVAFGLGGEATSPPIGEWDAWRERLPGTVFSDPDLPTLPPEASRHLAAAGATLRPLLRAARWPEDLLIDLLEISQACRLVTGADGAWDLAPDQRPLKARGLFYTPAPVAQRVVEAVFCDVDDAQTLLQDPPRLLDPAVGAGRFLIAALRHVAEACPDAPARALGAFLGALHGVDHCPQAVRQARTLLSLAWARHGGVRWAQGENPPDLTDRIRCGDSLLVEDGAASALLACPDGFDRVVANPPYQFGEHLPPGRQAYFRRHYTGAGRQIDTYGLFLEAAIRRLLRPGGRFAFLVPDALLVRRQTAPLRKLLVREGGVDGCEHLGDVFARIALNQASRKVGVSVILLSGVRGNCRPERILRRVEPTQPWGPMANTRHAPPNGAADSPIRNGELTHGDLLAEPDCRFLIYLDGPQAALLARLRQAGETVGDLLAPGGIGRGLETGKRSLAEHSLAAPGAAGALALATGDSVRPFRVGPPFRYAPAIPPAKQRLFDWQPKILVVKTGRRLVAARDDQALGCVQSVYCLRPRDEAAARTLEAWLNSELCRWIVEKTITACKGLMPQITQRELLELPVPPMTECERDRLDALWRRLKDTAANSPEWPNMERRLRDFWSSGLTPPRCEPLE